MKAIKLKIIVKLTNTTQNYPCTIHTLQHSVVSLLMFHLYLPHRILDDFCMRKCMHVYRQRHRPNQTKPRQAWFLRLQETIFITAIAIHQNTNYPPSLAV